MPVTNADVISCGSCNRQFAWKPELAGKRVKCKCGEKISIHTGSGTATATKSTPAKPAPIAVKKPKPPKPVVSADDPSDLDGLFALAQDADRAAAAMPVEVVNFVPSAATDDEVVPTKKAGNRAIPLGYRRGPSALERQKAQRDAVAIIDPVRDLYAPSGIMVLGLILSLSSFVVQYHLPSAAIPVVGFGVILLMLIKTVFLLGFAFATAGPLGVSYGTLWTAILKLAAIAVFVDGAIGWVDAGINHISGGTGGGSLFSFGRIGWILAVACYWMLLMYLFGMDPSESRMVVVVLSIFDRILRLVLLLILVNVILAWGGISAPVSSLAGSSGGGGSSSISTAASELETHVDELKDKKMLREAKAYIEDGHQAILKPFVADWYANGCPNVWFEMAVTDLNNRKVSGVDVIVELPKNKAKRTKCFDILKAYYKEAGLDVDPQDLKDDGGQYMEVGIR